MMRAGIGRLPRHRMMHGGVIEGSAFLGRRFHVHGIEGASLEHDGVTDRGVREVDQNVDALRRGKEGFAAAARGGQQTTVDTDERKRYRHPIGPIFTIGLLVKIAIGSQPPLGWSQ